MNIPLTIKAIKKLLNSLNFGNEMENYQTYASIKVLADELALHFQQEEPGNGNIRFLLAEIINHSKYAANLDGNHDQPSQYITYANTAIDSLKEATNKMAPPIKC